MFREVRERIPAIADARVSCSLRIAHDDLGLAVANSLAAIQGRPPARWSCTINAASANGPATRGA